jgi:hypothetical protein
MFLSGNVTGPRFGKNMDLSYSTEPVSTIENKFCSIICDRQVTGEMTPIQKIVFVSSVAEFS